MNVQVSLGYSLDLWVIYDIFYILLPKVAVIFQLQQVLAGDGCLLPWDPWGSIRLNWLIKEWIACWASYMISNWAMQSTLSNSFLHFIVQNYECPFLEPGFAFLCAFSPISSAYISAAVSPGFLLLFFVLFTLTTGFFWPLLVALRTWSSASAQPGAPSSISYLFLQWAKLT